MSSLRLEATEYVLDRSWTCRKWRRYACSLVRDAVQFLPGSPGVEPTGAWRDRLTSHLRERVQGQRVGNPVIVFLLLNVVVPIVVRLVIEWWVNRKEARSGASSQV